MIKCHPLVITLLLIVSAYAQIQNLIPFSNQIPVCTSSATYKEREVILQLIPSNQTTTTTSTCSMLFRSSFQCPHPYSVQVIEDNPQKCHHNFQNCVLHQRIYWTASGEFELEVNLVDSPAPPSSQLILHVIRLECDKKLKASLQAQREGGIPPSVTNKLRMSIYADEGRVTMMEDRFNTAAAADKVEANHPPNEMKKYLYFPQENTNFFLVSPGFPRNPVGLSNCLFVIPRTNIQTCRLRITFRFFNLPDPDERTCQHHFLVIDNKRICGCKTGLVYLSQMDSRPKIIRYVNKINPSAFGDQRSFGFLLEVQREGCPYRYRAEGGHRVIKRMTYQQRDIEPVSGFYHNRHSPQVCQFSFSDWMKVLANPLWTRNKRPSCTAPEHLGFL